MDKGQVFFRTGFNYDREEASRESAYVPDPDEPCLVQQHHKEECDINTIVERFGLAGTVPENFRMPLSGDFTGISDFHQAANLVVAAEEAFMQLPAELRKEFNHDPARLMAFLDDDKNRSKAEELGLVAKPPEKTRDVVQAVDELAAALKPKEGA